MGGLRMSKVVVAVLVVWMSILLISLTEVDGEKCVLIKECIKGPTRSVNCGIECQLDGYVTGVCESDGMFVVLSILLISLTEVEGETCVLLKRCRTGPTRSGDCNFDCLLESYLSSYCNHNGMCICCNDGIAVSELEM
ncbi:hypothetical protein AALP_AA1G033300 [Arabis alpina]|uniref:Defensin-like protein n=1 Tax=Arabis alpina TaxID=50452 RepID=A0A087HKT5_ARAAL|nr:hypothetical protein AALP_AA1G033300 [Arabis alpina]